MLVGCGCEHRRGTVDDLDSLEETLELLSNADAVRELVEAEAAVASGDVIRGINAVRVLGQTTAQRPTSATNSSSHAPPRAQSPNNYPK